MQGPKTKAAPATVSGLGLLLCHWETGKVTDHHAASQETGLQSIPTPLSGVTGLGDRIMTTETKLIAVATPATAGIAFAFITGLALLFASGYAQATGLHDAAHDQRHAMAFPCH